MTDFANLTAVPMDPAPPAAALDAIATDVYVTPAQWRVSLGDLARLSYLRARWRAALELSAAGAGQVTVRLTDGATTLASWVVDTSAGVIQHQDAEVDLAAVSGTAALRLALDVDTAAPGGTTGRLWGALVLEHPLVIGGCG